MSQFYEGSVSWNVGNILDGDEADQDITVTGAAFGDYVQVSASLSFLDLTCTAHVSAANTVTIILANNTGGTVDMLTPTMYVKVEKRLAIVDA